MNPDLKTVAKATAGIMSDRDTPSLSAELELHELRQKAAADLKQRKIDERRFLKAQKSLKVARRRATKKAIKQGKCTIGYSVGSAR